MTSRALALPLGYEYFWYDDIDSTNQEALRHSIDGQKPNRWFCAKQQTHGRGTNGKEWVSQTGNLFASLFVRSSCASNQLSQISILAGLAAITAIEHLASDEFEMGDLCLKWPNDILLGGKKVCGILAESRLSGESDLFDIVIGSGINLALSPRVEGFAPAGNLSDEGWSCSRTELFVALVQSTRDWLSIWQHGKGFETLRLAWLERSCHIGQNMTLKVGKAEFEGRMTTMSPTGAIVLEDKHGNEKEYSSGSIINIEGSFSR